jgi:hypothetical protein
MIRYEWYAAKLTTPQSFPQCQQVAFLAEAETAKCECIK